MRLLLQLLLLVTFLYPFSLAAETGGEVDALQMPRIPVY
jgi:hypothetical protein